MNIFQSLVLCKVDRKIVYYFTNLCTKKSEKMLVSPKRKRAKDRRREMCIRDRNHTHVEITLVQDLLTELKFLRDNPDSIIEEPNLIAKELIKDFCLAYRLFCTCLLYTSRCV